MAEQSERYAAAVTMRHDKDDGTISIVTLLAIYEAVSTDEARGIAFTGASASNPQHSVLSILACPILLEPPTTEGEQG